jgi:hypothetical protein
MRKSAESRARKQPKKRQRASKPRFSIETDPVRKERVRKASIACGVTEKDFLENIIDVHFEMAEPIRVRQPLCLTAGQWLDARVDLDALRLELSEAVTELRAIRKLVGNADSHVLEAVDSLDKKLSGPLERLGEIL